MAGGKWTSGKPPALITFDDGYKNNSTIAAELLSRKGMPAIFFLSTDYIGRDRVLWPDILFARISAWKASDLRLPGGETTTVPEGCGEQRVALAFRGLQDCKDSSEEKRLEYLAYLAGETPQVNVKLAPQVQDFMTWDEARGLARHGFELGSHTVTHPILSRIGPEQLKRELAESRKKVEAETGSRCIAIAYPNGSPRDYSPEVLRATEEAGYEFGFIVSGRWSRRLPVSVWPLIALLPLATPVRALSHSTRSRCAQPVGLNRRPAVFPHAKSQSDEAVSKQHQR